MRNGLPLDSPETRRDCLINRDVWNKGKYRNIYACIINIYVPHEVKNQRALAKRASRTMKHGQDVAIQMWQM